MTNKDKIDLRDYLGIELQRLEDICSISIVESCPDEGDLAAQFNQRRVEMALNQRQQKRRGELENTLKRLDTEDFGICEECDGDIGMARIKANPTALLCVRCQEEADRRLRACA